MRIKPKFNSKCPENWSDFFMRASDDEFKRIHPIAYPILVCIGYAVFLSPAAAFYNAYRYIYYQRSRSNCTLGNTWDIRLVSFLFR